MPSVNFASPVQEISPKTTVPANATTNEYFANEAGGSTTSAKTSDSIGSSENVSSVVSDQQTPKLDNAATEGDKVDFEGAGLRRQSSVSSVNFQLPRNQNLPQGSQKRINKGRLRNASPKPNRFQNRVAFDNLPLGEGTKNNTPSLTLNVRHKGYRAGRRSRTFMVGVDEHTYSDYALEWLLDELVDDGDEIVCVRVIEKEIRSDDEYYRPEARKIMQNIQQKNGANKALSLILEYAVGKLHTTFQRLIQMHEPAMLVVGTKGRSLGGLQGLMNTRNSFSKYCLQYSPVPVVVVRPTEKRNKKKDKRAADSTRQTYAGMLSANQGRHEVDIDTTGPAYAFEVQISAEQEASQVAKVLGLPASFDPTIKPLVQTSPRIPRSSTAPSLQPTEEVPEPIKEAPNAPMSAGSDSSDSEEEEGEGEGDFEVMDGKEMLDKQQKDQHLHEMEMNEAAALKMKVESDSEDESDDEKKTAI